jgi:hypothetical protein
MLNLKNLLTKNPTPKEKQVEPKRATQTQEIPRPIVQQESFDRSPERLLRGMK